MRGGQCGGGFGPGHINAGHDHVSDAGRGRALEHRVAVGIEPGVGQVDTDVDQAVELHSSILLESVTMMKSDATADDRPMDWVGDWSGRRRLMTPSRTALIEPATARHWTYAELDERARRWAHWIVNDAGLAKGAVIALMTRNRREAVELFLAAGKTGVVIAPVSHRLTAAEASALIRRLNPDWLIYDAALAANVAGLDASALDGVTSLAFGTTGGGVEAALSGQPTDPINRALALSDPCLLVHTGGSTGLPKICRISHRQMLWNAVELLVAADGGLPRRRELVLFPLFHIGGWNTLLPILYAGGCAILPEAFDPPAVLQAIDDHSVNHFGAVEAMLQALSADPAFERHTLHALEAITTAGGPCAEARMAPFLARGITIRQSYGLTEAGPSNFININDLNESDDPALERRSIGTSFFHTDYRIVDPERLEPCDVDEPGELQMRSPHDFDGYLDDAAGTTERWTVDGWIRSGDLACADAAGRVFIVGRLDNVIVSGGENIAAEEVEAVLQEHPDVSGALVFGVADTHWGERPVAWVTGDETLTDEALRDWLQGRLARFKHPVVIECVESLPLTGAGKPDRRRAREQHQPISQGGAP